MLFSIFTPTHDPIRLRDCFESLKRQTVSDWEWVVVANGPRTEDIVRTLESWKDDRVRIVRADPDVEPGNIGYLKHVACQNARGEVLVELDHDDFLLPECLNEITHARWLKPSAGFFCSDAIMATLDKRSLIFEGNGWEYYKFEYDGTDYTIAKMFPIEPRSLCQVYFAPNHLRAWTREAYWRIGGHDPKLPLADDHDLLCRTYLAGIEMVHIEKPLYYNRHYNESTYQTRNEEIQTRQNENMNKYLHPLIFEWCKRNNLKMLDLGGAHDCPKGLGFESVDMYPAEGVDYVFDVRLDTQFDRHFPDNSVGCFRAVDFIEHIPSSQVPDLMNRLYRKLAPGGWILFEVPSVSGPNGEVGRGAFQDPTHVSFWCENSFWYYTRTEQAKYVPEIKCRFQAVRLWTDYPTEFHAAHFIPYVNADLMAVKDDQRVPGDLFI